MSFGRVVLTAGLTSLTLGALARGYSWLRHGPAKTLPPADCPPKGAHIAGLAVARRELGSVRAAGVLVLVHDQGDDGEAMLEVVAGLRRAVIVLGPTGPMPATDGGAAWTWAEPGELGFASAVGSAGALVAVLLREVRRCNPGRRLIAAGHGQGAHVLLAAAAIDPTLADELVVVGAALPEGLVPAALPRTTWLHALDDAAVPVEAARARATELAELGLPVTFTELEGTSELAGPMQASLLAELERALGPEQPMNPFEER
jgi:predicted esterase